MKYHREVRVDTLFTFFYFPLLGFLLFLSFLFISIFVINILWVIILAASLLLLYIILTIKRFVIGMVLAYKCYAPKATRDRCRFTPCCSTYMILAIEKYGLFKGVAKGINRIKRCKPPNGGEDYP